MIGTGLLAGTGGTVALSLFERLEWAALGRRMPVYAATVVGRGLAERWLGRGRLPRHDLRFGYLLRWLYGLSLGVLFMKIRGRLPRRPVAAGLCLGAGVFCFEVAVMPAVGATPPIRTWSRAERFLLLLHTTVFGIGTASSGHILEGASARRVTPV